MLEPVSVLLKFGFLAILFLFLVWVARSGMRELRASSERAVVIAPADATGLHPASAGLPASANGTLAALRVERGPGLETGVIYDLGDEALFGRGAGADIALEDPYASSRHARISRQGSVVVLEDLGSTNGTYLNGEPLRGPAPLHPGDRIKIGDSEFSYDA